MERLKAYLRGAGQAASMATYMLYFGFLVLLFGLAGQAGRLFAGEGLDDAD